MSSGWRVDATASVSLHRGIKSPHRLNLGPVKAVSHGGSGWVASEGDRGREREREPAVERNSLWLRKVDGQREAGGNVCKGRKNLCETSVRRNSLTPK